MKTVIAFLLSACALQVDAVAAGRGVIGAEPAPPKSFPHRIWAACDFEGSSPDYAWFGRPETNHIPVYPGNRTALAAAAGPHQNVSASMAGINPVPGPRMGKENGMFVRYLLRGGDRATFQHFSLTREDNWHIIVTNLAQGRWSTLTLNYTRDARRNDGSSEPFAEGERMDDFKVFAGQPEQADRYALFLDDIIFFANDPAAPPEPEPFPNRIIFLSAFDTGEKEKYWPGDFDLVEEDLPPGSFWRAARSVRRPQGRAEFISLKIEPPRPVGEHTRLRFRYYLSGTSTMTVQIFDATVQDNRHVRLTGLREGAWTTLYVDLSRDSRRNDGTSPAPFTAGNLVDDLFFFLDEGSPNARLLLDEVVLYDAAKAL